MPVVVGSLVVGMAVGVVLSLQHYGFAQTAAAETLDKVIMPKPTATKSAGGWGTVREPVSTRDGRLLCCTRFTLSVAAWQRKAPTPSNSRR